MAEIISACWLINPRSIALGASPLLAVTLLIRPHSVTPGRRCQVGDFSGRFRSRGPNQDLVAQLDAADSRYMKVYSRSAVIVIPISVVIPIAVVIPVPAAVHIQTAPAGSPVAVVIPMVIPVAAHPAIAVDADFTATPLRAGRAREQHRGSQGRHSCSN
jgi:hypothetical protein